MPGIIKYQSLLQIMHTQRRIVLFVSHGGLAALPGVFGFGEEKNGAPAARGS